jgi:heme/copper-type cytochrome/quinol oxidase subunit 2
MTQPARTAPRHQEKHHHPSLAFFCVEVFVGILLCAAFASGVYFSFALVAQATQQERHAHVNLSIIINQSGYQQDWPAYAPSTVVVPTNSLVTVTIRNYDLGDTSLPEGSPFTTVHGMVGGVAYADGHAYSSLAPEKVSHTFTVPQLKLNVPVPGDTATGKPYVDVSFTFRTGTSGSYTFECFDPCGTGTTGWQGPMTTMGYMLGTLTVQG